MSFTYVLHARPLRICIRTPSSAPIDRSPGGFWDSAKVYYSYVRIIHVIRLANQPTPTKTSPHDPVTPQPQAFTALLALLLLFPVLETTGRL